jgi:uncharacterized DUF497 family protein
MLNFLQSFEYNWSDSKNTQLLQTRNISFMEVVKAITTGGLLEIIENPSKNFNHQKCFVVNVKNYIYLVPFVANGNEIFLKTIFPSRKFNKIYNLTGKK